MTDLLLAKIAAADFDEAEEAFLGALETKPDGAALGRAVKALVEAGEKDRAAALAGMADDQLRQSKAWRDRLAILRAAGHLLYKDPLALHDEIVRSLIGAHRDSELGRKLVDKAGLQRAPEDIPKTWEKVDRVDELMALAPGTVVAMEGKGAGRVADINLQLDSFKIDIPGLGMLSVGFAAAKKMLRPLPEDHVLRRRLEDPATLVALKTERPEELVRIALQSYPEPLTGNELRQALASIVTDAEWTSFWNRAKKSPQIVALPGSRQRYHWASSAGAAVAGVREGFGKAPLAEKLDLLKSHGTRDKTLLQEMTASLLEDAKKLRAKDPAAALEVALALEKAGASPPGELAPAALLMASEDPMKLLIGADRGVREEIYRRLPGARTDWRTWYEKALLREDEPKLLDLLADGLAAESRESFDRIVGELLTQPRKFPASFTWLAERAAREEALLQRSPLRLFQQILAGTADELFSTQKKRLLRLADSGGTLPRILPFLEPAQAAQAEEAVGKAPGLEEYQREALKNALHLRFPSLRQEAEQPLYATPEAIVAKKEELRKLLEEEIPANRRAIEEARALGDLRENFEYKSARQRHEYLAARASGLDRDLRRARPIDVSKVDASAARVGTKLHLAGPAGEARTITVLGAWESQPELGILSHESELATSILGKEVGDTITLEGKPYRIVSIVPYR